MLRRLGREVAPKDFFQSHLEVWDWGWAKASERDWVTVNDYEAEWGDGRITHWADPLLPTGQVTDWPDFQREDLS